MNKSWRRWIGLSLHLSVDFITALFIGTLIGRGLDFYMGTHPLGLVIFIIIGIIAGGFNVYRSALNLVQSKIPPNAHEN